MDVFIFILYLGLVLLSQILLKKSVIELTSFETKFFLMKIYKKPLVIFAYCLSGLSIVFWVTLLRYFQLGEATLYSSMLFALIFFCDILLDNYKPSIINYLGLFLLLLGIIFIL